MSNIFRSLFLMLLFASTQVLAEKEPLPGPADPRVRTIMYNPRDVVILRGAYGYSMTVRFSDREEVQDIALGDSKAWQAKVSGDGRGVLLKPMEENASTNMLVRTTRRMYNFSLAALNVSSPNDPALTYSVTFTYPQDELEVAAAAEQRKAQEVSDTPVGPEALNFRYTWSGSSERKPQRVFDDGKFTYFEFPEGARVPAIFVVDAEKKEAIVNWHQRGRYVVVERIDHQFSLRDGDLVTCVFNESLAGPGKPTRSRKPL